MMFGSLVGTVHNFDHCESLKTNMAAFQWHVCSFQRLCEDSDIFLLSKCFTDCFPLS